MAAGGRSVAVMLERCFLHGLAILLLAWAGIPQPAWAAATVEVIETWPAGEHIAIAPKQAYHLRMSYTTDVPVRIWARPYFEGQQVPTTTHASSLHEGSGETSGWFSLERPWQRVDEVRISVSDGSRDSPVVARHRVDIVSDPEAAAAGPEPGWIEDNRVRDVERTRVDDLRRQEEPGGFLATLLVSGVVMMIPVFVILGLVTPVWAFWRWRGGWRLAAALPLVVLGVVLLNIMVGVAIDPTSHNLWPFEILMVAIPGLAWIGVLALLRRRRTPGSVVRRKG